MNKTCLKFLMAAVLSTTTLVQFVHGLGKGSDAPEVKPSEWLNYKGVMSWEELSGRLVLVEKWATW